MLSEGGNSLTLLPSLFRIGWHHDRWTLAASHGAFSLAATKQSGVVGKWDSFLTPLLMAYANTDIQLNGSVRHATFFSRTDAGWPQAAPRC